MKDSELSTLLEDALKAEKFIVRSICHNSLREELYGEKLQKVVIFHLENFVKNILDLAICNNLIEYDQTPTEKDKPGCDIEQLGLSAEDVEEFGKSFLKNIDELAEIDDDPENLHKSNQSEAKK